MKDFTSPPDSRTGLAIDLAPLKVRKYGLAECHNYPRVSRGKNRSGVYQPPRRVAVGQAWEYPSLEIGRSATARTAIVLDCDGPAATERATDWFLANEAHWFNWSVVRRSSGGTHFVLCLERPVLIGPNALSGPQLKLKRITGWLVDQTGADPANLGDMSHNPMARPQGPNLSTTWGRQEPHRLDDLGGLVPPDWQPPELEGTGNGRNDDFNRELAKWRHRLRTSINQSWITLWLCIGRCRQNGGNFPIRSPKTKSGVSPGRWRNTDGN